MPTLEQHEDGDGYYAKVFRGENRVGTWQISPGGVDWLAENGCGVGQEFSHAQLDELICLRMAINDGGPIEGTGRPTSRSIRAPELKVIQPNGMLMGPRLILHVIRASSHGRRHADRSRWHLELALPSYRELEGKPGRDLRKCSLIITSAGILLPIASLRDVPGRVPVPPQIDRYTVALEGPVPAKWQYDLWTAGADGLNPNGTLFTYHEGGSRRVLSGEPALPGKGYYLLRRRGPLPPVLKSLVHRTFSGYLGWALHYVHISDQPDEGLPEWLQLIGNPLAMR